MTQSEKSSANNSCSLRPNSNHDYHAIDEFGGVDDNSSTTIRRTPTNPQVRCRRLSGGGLSPTNSVESFEFINLGQQQQQKQRSSGNEQIINVASYETSWDSNPTFILLNSLKGITNSFSLKKKKNINLHFLLILK